MSETTFDKKFGEEFLSAVPTTPGVYRYLDDQGQVIYVGKAKNLKRRLQNYRNASRKKAHRKMRRIVKQAHALVYETVATETEALLVENRLIAELKPRLNVDGAFSFLYPSLGTAQRERQTLLCMTTDPEMYRSLSLDWYGAFRSRSRTKIAFESLVSLLSLLGHLEPRSALPAHQSLRGSRLVGLRRVPPELIESLPTFLAGQDSCFLRTLAQQLLNKPRARREAADVEEHLLILRAFFQNDAVKLNQALRKLAQPGSYVPAEQRDALFIHAR